MKIQKAISDFSAELIRAMLITIPLASRIAICDLNIYVRNIAESKSLIPVRVLCLSLTSSVKTKTAVIAHN